MDKLKLYETVELKKKVIKDMAYIFLGLISSLVHYYSYLTVVLPILRLYIL